MDEIRVEQMYLKKQGGFQVDSIDCNLIKDVHKYEENIWHSERGFT